MKREEYEAPWKAPLLMKERDRFSRNGSSKSIVDARPESVATGRKIEEIGRAGADELEWSSNRPAIRRSRRSPATRAVRRAAEPAPPAVRERAKVPPKPTRKGPPKRDPGRKVPVKEPPAEDPPKPPVREPPSEAREASHLGVRVTHPGRVIDPGSETTKGDLAAYMEAVAERMFPHVEGRPLMLRRCPDGIHRECFFQKHPSTPLPPSLATVSVTESKGKRPYVSVRTPAGLVSLVQMGAVEVHVWGSRADRDDRPDRMVFDLDPDPSVSWNETVRTAHSIRTRLEEIGLTSVAKTTGGKGIHVVVPIRRGPDWKTVADLSGAIASEFARGDPGRFTTHLAKDKRRGRILIDTLRNRRGATWVAPYSPRAREGLTVSTPIAWSELSPRFASERLTIATVPKRLQRPDPWSGMERVTQTITASMLRDIARKTAARHV